MQLFLTLMTPAVCQLRFFKLHNHRVKVPLCVFVPNFVVIGQTVAELWQFISFQNGCHPPSVDFLTVHRVKMPNFPSHG